MIFIVTSHFKTYVEGCVHNEFNDLQFFLECF